MRLTDRSISGTNPPTPVKGEVVIFDDSVPGFGLRIRSTGGRSWVYVYWHGGRARRVTLGSWPKLSAKLARDMVGPLARQVGEGKDPQDAKLEAKVRKQTVGEIADIYLSAKAKELRPRSLVEVERHLTVNAKPLHKLPVESLSLRDVAALLTTLAADKGPIAANRTRASLSAMLSWATKQGLATANPVAFTGKQVERSRERVLSDNELPKIWNALGDGDYAAIVKLLILTGCRREEIAALCWSEINLTDRQIILPGHRVKNNRPHVIPLSKQSMNIINLMPRAEGRDFVFGYGSGGFSGWGQCKRRLDDRLSKMPKWTLHDLRRTAATGMAKLGTPPHVIEAVLNHVSGHKGGVAGIYNRADYLAERREALSRWGDHIDKLLTAKQDRAA